MRCMRATKIALKIMHSELLRQQAAKCTYLSLQAVPLLGRPRDFPDSLKVTLFRQRYAAFAAYHDMVKCSYADETQRIHQFMSQRTVSRTGFGIA